MRTFHIVRPDESIRADILQKIDNLNKPKGSLGRLETLVEQICLIQQTLSPTLEHPCHLLFGGDHGIEREHVSVSPRDVTWQQMKNFTRGGGGVNMFCRQHGFKLRIVDVGVDYDLSDTSGIIDRKIARGTRNFLHEAGCNIICMGEMGIANTSPSSIWMHLFGNIPLDECIGVGAGLNNPGLQHKREVLHEAVDHFRALNSHPSTLEIIRYFGGFEMTAAIGAMLRAAEQRMIVLVDGFIMTACALAATRLFPEALPYMVFGHCGDESGHQRMLALMDAQPLLRLGLRLGEGTGALCAFPIVQSAVNMVNEMNNFQNANITKYF